MTESQMKERVKLLLRGSSPDAGATGGDAPPPLPGPASDQALQVLALAQRTAEDHLAAANRQAEKSKADAKAAAARMGQAAEEHAERVRSEAEQLMDAAREAAEVTARDAQQRAAEIRRQAEATLASAQAEADSIVARGVEQAEQLQRKAAQRYENAVGGLGVKREALQKQIEMLEVFNADYRAQLAAFVQNQLRALWNDQPQVAEGPALVEAG